MLANGAGRLPDLVRPRSPGETLAEGARRSVSVDALPPQVFRYATRESPSSTAVRSRVPTGDTSARTARTSRDERRDAETAHRTRRTCQCSVAYVRRSDALRATIAGRRHAAQRPALSAAYDRASAARARRPTGKQLPELCLKPPTLAPSRHSRLSRLSAACIADRPRSPVPNLPECRVRANLSPISERGLRCRRTARCHAARARCRGFAHSLARARVRKACTQI
jgi:hypothetical protein